MLVYFTYFFLRLFSSQVFRQHVKHELRYEKLEPFFFLFVDNSSPERESVEEKGKQTKQGRFSVVL